jgi:hypothetical protein
MVALSAASAGAAFFVSAPVANMEAGHMHSSDKTSAPLLYSRIQAARLLGGVSVATIRRMEAGGRLSPVKLSGKRAGQVFYQAQQVHGLAEKGADASIAPAVDGPAAQETEACRETKPARERAAAKEERRYGERARVVSKRGAAR